MSLSSLRCLACRMSSQVNSVGVEFLHVEAWIFLVQKRKVKPFPWHFWVYFWNFLKRILGICWQQMNTHASSGEELYIIFAHSWSTKCDQISSFPRVCQDSLPIHLAHYNPLKTQLWTEDADDPQMIKGNQVLILLFSWTVGLRWSVQMNKPGLVIVIVDHNFGPWGFNWLRSIGCLFFGLLESLMSGMEFQQSQMLGAIDHSKLVVLGWRSLLSFNKHFSKLEVWCGDTTEFTQLLCLMYKYNQPCHHTAMNFKMENLQLPLTCLLCWVHWWSAIIPAVGLLQL